MTRPHLLGALKAAPRTLAAAALAVAGLLTTAAAPAGAATAPGGDGIPKPHRPACDNSLARPLDAAVRHAMREGHLPGAIVGLWMPGHCEYVRAFGKADLKTGAPMRTDLNMRIGSETKTFVATAVLQQVDAHRVRLDDPIGKYIHGVPDGNHITVRELLEMRSGLFPYSDDPDFIQALESNPHRYFTPEQLLAYGFKHPNVFPPGTQSQYSNTNYILLGLLLEKVTHESVEQYLQDCVIKPSHLTHTLLPHGAFFPDPHAHGYTNQTLNGQVADATSWNTSWAWAAGAMVSDLRDLRAWAKDVATGTLLSPATQAQRERFLPTPLENVGYGLGLFDANGWIGHDGSLPGYQSLPIYLPEQHTTLVVLINTDISTNNVAPTTLVGKAITSIVTPDHVYDLVPKA